MDNPYFVKEMQELLKEDWEKFSAAFSLPMAKALRINPLKADHDKIAEEIELKAQTSFDENTYLIDDESHLGRHPYHAGGLYYLQEPSATMAVNALQIEKGDRVLDLCAAPGGKSTQILAQLQNTGFLFCNEYENKRAITLLSNLERWGSNNYLLTNASTDELCPLLSGLMDKVLVDAPCSGASMFKKYPETVKDYNENSVLACAKRQGEILDNAYLTLKENGILVYSTCTYNRTEDEDCVQSFLQRHPDMELLPSGLTCGQKGFDEKGYTRRVFPYQHGEGHFCARMQKRGTSSIAKLKTIAPCRNELVEEFLKRYCDDRLNYIIIKDKVYGSENDFYDLKSNVIRQGILMGELVKGRFEPAHHFFVSLWANQHYKNICNLTDTDAVQRFLSGNVLNIAGMKGYVQIRYQDVAIGFGKGDGNQIKNHFPKGLRLL